MKTSSNKRTYVLVAILLLCLVAWFLLKMSNGASSYDAAGVGGDVIGVSATALLSEVQSIKLDFSLLHQPAFLNLINRTGPLLNLPVGNKTPFAAPQ